MAVIVVRFSERGQGITLVYSPLVAGCARIGCFLGLQGSLVLGEESVERIW